MTDLSQLSMAFDTSFQLPIEEPDADVSFNKINSTNKRNQEFSVEPLDLQTQLKHFPKRFHCRYHQQLKNYLLCQLLL